MAFRDQPGRVCASALLQTTPAAAFEHMTLPTLQPMDYAAYELGSLWIVHVQPGSEGAHGSLLRNDGRADGDRVLRLPPHRPSKVFLG